jgi:stalled ribosome alternative rescue factor ArfA
MQKKCIDNYKCENWLDVNQFYEVKQSEIRENCYSVLVKDKLQRLKKEHWFDFLKTKFE